MSLPPGQIARTDFPRFGLPKFATRFPEDINDRHIDVGGDAGRDFFGDPMEGLPRVDQISAFHCVTTWSVQGLKWSGTRFSDFMARHSDGAKWVILRAQDGYRTLMLAEDLAAADVLIADRLNGVNLSVLHGAPFRLIAPAHYGYKSVKHLDRVEFWTKRPKLKANGFAFMDHPRARVALEERGRFFPGWLLRRLYRPLIKRTEQRFAQELQRHEALATTGS
jgi:DMSO/TMAO reductase YedYZ molybdopterin-dependent catalytic subunit